jgi:hypothetical protein
MIPIDDAYLKEVKLLALFNTIEEMELAARHVANDLTLVELFEADREIMDDVKRTHVLSNEDMKALAIIRIAEKMAMEDLTRWKT